MSEVKDCKACWGKGLDARGEPCIPCSGWGWTYKPLTFQQFNEDKAEEALAAAIDAVSKAKVYTQILNAICKHGDNARAAADEIYTQLFQPVPANAMPPGNGSPLISAGKPTEEV